MLPTLIAGASHMLPSKAKILRIPAIMLKYQKQHERVLLTFIIDLFQVIQSENGKSITTAPLR